VLLLEGGVVIHKYEVQSRRVGYRCRRRVDIRMPSLTSWLAGSIGLDQKGVRNVEGRIKTTSTTPIFPRHTSFERAYCFSPDKGEAINTAGLFHKSSTLKPQSPLQRPLTLCAQHESLQVTRCDTALPGTGSNPNKLLTLCRSGPVPSRLDLHPTCENEGFKCKPLPALTGQYEPLLSADSNKTFRSHAPAYHSSPKPYTS
jgi:hypothetical protein